ncbi:hypothetical protein RJ640_010662 [Escallonia rubra]|uniref:Squamosa promoter-binding-like protein 9 n=1 Tax=Escallonia rubra TaxID=112253 RepID=A0AA88UI61_9ASTE|nr:hypothetical protein RJ640_010662 [Escallonia rubra]
MQMGSTNSSESLNGLKFGKKIYFEDVGIGVPAKSGGGSSSAGGGSTSCQNLTKESEVAADAWLAIMSVAGSHRLENGSRGGGFLMDFASHRVSGRGPWPNGRASEQLSGNQPTAIGKFVPHPWQSNSENPPPDIQGSANRTPYPGPAMSSGGCFTGVSDSSCALSLLSNQPWGSRSQPSSLGENTLLHSEGPPMIQAAATHGAAVSHFSSSSWGFKGNEAASSSHEMHPHLGLGQVSHSATGHYSGELELAQHGGRQYMEVEHSRAYDSSAQHMHWSL